MVGIEPGMRSPELWHDIIDPVRDPVHLGQGLVGVVNMLNNVRCNHGSEVLVRIGDVLYVAMTHGIRCASWLCPC